MNHRRWTNSGLENIGISKSALRSLDTVETAMQGLGRINTAIGRAADMHAGIHKAEAEVKRTGVGVLDAVSALNDKIPTVDTPMGRVSDASSGVGFADRLEGSITPLTGVRHPGPGFGRQCCWAALCTQ